MNNQNTGYDQSGVIEDGSLEQLVSHLKPGMIIKAKILLKLDEYNYLLRISNYNLVLESRLAFNRFDEIYILVSAVEPKLMIQMIGIQIPGS